jgi:hypothetical protein
MPGPGAGLRRYQGEAMKKTSVKKLALAKETLIRLEDSAVEIARGAATGYAGCPDWTNLRTCVTCDHNTCTTNRC